MLADAHALYRGLRDHRRDCGDKDKDRDSGLALSMVDMEADYLQMLLGLKGFDEVERDGETRYSVTSSWTHKQVSFGSEGTCLGNKLNTVRLDCNSMPQASSCPMSCRVVPCHAMSTSSLAMGSSHCSAYCVVRFDPRIS